MSFTSLKTEKNLSSFDEHIQKTILDIETYSTIHNNVWRITRDQGLFLNALAKNITAKKILELGTSVGYSSIFLAEAAKQNGRRRPRG